MISIWISFDKWRYRRISDDMDEVNACFKALFREYDSIIAFDVETSGLDPARDQIVQLAFVKLTPDSKRIDQQSIGFLIQLYDGHSMSKEACVVNRITDNLLTNYGISIHEAIDRLLALTENEKCLFVAHNAAFDLSFLHAALAYCGKLDYFYRIDALDTLTVFKDRHPYPHKLSDAIAVYQLDNVVENSHSAIEDTKALVRVLIKMDEEKADLKSYINLFGYNPKYPPKSQLCGYKYAPQPYNSHVPLYAKFSPPPSHTSSKTKMDVSEIATIYDRKRETHPELLTCPDCCGIVSNRAKFCPHCGCPIEFILTSTATINNKADSPFTGTLIRHLELGEGRVIAIAGNEITINCGGGNIVLSVADFYRSCIFQDKTIRDQFLKEYDSAIRSIPTVRRIYIDNEEYYDYDFDDSGPDEESYAYYFRDDEIL